MAKKKKNKHGEEEAGEAWLLPYSDLMTLLLAVFIVLFAVSKIDQAKATQMAEAFTEQMIAMEPGGASSGGSAKGSTAITELNKEEAGTHTEGIGSPAVALPKNAEQQEFDNLQDLKIELDLLFENDNAAQIVTKIDKRGLVISLNNAILFESGSAQVQGEHKDILIKIAEKINKLGNYIRIEGHTDNIPIKTASNPSNWELSTARAVSVVRLFESECNIPPEKIVAVGYGEYKPVADNATAEGRAKNRRIDIIVLSEKYNSLEQHIVP